MTQKTKKINVIEAIKVNPLRIEKKNIAILVFANTPEVEVKRKSFAGDSENNKQIASTLFRFTLNEANITGLPVFLIDEKGQHGNTFGEKLANAFDFVFRKGYENIIAIGSDCPQLDRITILKTAALLGTNSVNVVIGPSADGGMYLIGLNKSAFKKPIFINTTWQCGQDHQQFKTSLINYGFYIHILPKKVDVDHQPVLQWLLHNKMVNRYLYFQLVTIVPIILFHVFIFQNNSLATLLLQNIGLRAPPTPIL